MPRTTRRLAPRFLTDGQSRRLKLAEQHLLEARTNPDLTLAAMIYRIEMAEDIVRSVQRELRWHDLDREELG